MPNRTNFHYIFFFFFSFYNIIKWALQVAIPATHSIIFSLVNFMQRISKTTTTAELTPQAVYIEFLMHTLGILNISCHKLCKDSTNFDMTTQFANIFRTGLHPLHNIAVIKEAPESKENWTTSFALRGNTHSIASRQQQRHKQHQRV